MMREVMQISPEYGTVLCLGIERRAEREKLAADKESFFAPLRAAAGALRATRSLGAAKATWTGTSRYLKGAKGVATTEKALAGANAARDRASDAWKTMAAVGDDPARAMRTVTEQTGKVNALSREAEKARRQVDQYQQFAPPPKAPKAPKAPTSPTGEVLDQRPQNARGASGGPSSPASASSPAPASSPTSTAAGASDEQASAWQEWANRARGYAKANPLRTAGGVGAVGLLGGMAAGGIAASPQQPQQQPYYPM